MQEQINKLIEQVKNLTFKKVHRSDIANKEVKQYHIDGLIVFRGNVADRPVDGSTEKQMFYAEDEKKLYVWNRTNKTWEHVTFT